MSIPIDCLYHYIQQVSEEIRGDRVIIYRFWPHGSKNINDLLPLTSLTWAEAVTAPTLYCYDQEPLYHDLYCDKSALVESDFTKFFKSQNLYIETANLVLFKTIFKTSLLLHSEKRSSNLEKYLSEDIIPVYYWSHALISRDWFRFAQHTTQHKNVEKIFLIYNRAWAGTREYRLRFAEFLIRLDLQNHCKTSVNPVEPELGIHYELHKFKNPDWRPNTVLENFFPINNAHSHYSADFNIKDYEVTDIEVVLETLFDDDRLHLTEKSLRPIACGQPFILAGTHGSLEYLRSYGFKTFGHVWDEGYDECADPEERLSRIADLMKQIASWAPQVRERKMIEACAIADYNRQHFFSQDFFDQVVNELKTNLKLAFNQLDNCNNYSDWIDRWKFLISNPKIIEFLKLNKDPILPTISQVEYVLKYAQSKLEHISK